jgi:argininosuccinate lyase
MMKKLWEGRFSEKTAEIVEAFTASIDIDKRLYAQDIEGSIAHCKMLAEAAIISDDDAAALVVGLEQIRAEIQSGEFVYVDRLEDIHMHIESRLAEIAGDVAQKLHTARSRNDQVALDVRMYLRETTVRIIRQLIRLQQVLVALAKEHIEIVMPGYTHLQRAQPVLFSHHLMAYYEMLLRDIHRFEDGFKRINVMPLGSAALAGTTYPIDRNYTAKLLDFPVVSANSIDSVSDRDFIIEFVSTASICMLHFSRLSEELIIWSTAEFGFVELPDSFATGSSIMPQKKNPDVSELVRGKSGRVFGDLMALLTMMKALPLAYNRDMQEDKSLLFDAVDIVSACIEIHIQMLPKIKLKDQVLRSAAATGFSNATDLADYLVGKGMPFRQAHHCVGKAVSAALNQNRELHELDLGLLQTFSDLIQEDIYEFLTPDRMIERRLSLGGTATKRVKAAVKKAEAQLVNLSQRYRLDDTGDTA